MEAEILKSLAAAGPATLVLAFVLWKLWVAYQVREEKCNAAIQAVQDKNDRLQEQMVKLAVRVQLAVETLAGIDHDDSTEVEDVLRDSGDNRGRGDGKNP